MIAFFNCVELVRKPHPRGDIRISRADCVQTRDGEIIEDFGRRYLVEQGTGFLPCMYIEEAERVASEIYEGRRMLGAAELEKGQPEEAPESEAA